MPIPVPTTDKEGNADLGNCIRFLRKEKPDMPPEQREAICLDLWRKATGKKPYKGGK